MEYTKKEEKKAIKDLKSFLEFLEETYILKGKIYLHIDVLDYNRKNLDAILSLLERKEKEIERLQERSNYYEELAGKYQGSCILKSKIRKKMRKLLFIIKKYNKQMKNGKETDISYDELRKYVCELEVYRKLLEED